MNGTTYYRLAPAAIDTTIQDIDSDATESDSNDSTTRKGMLHWRDSHY